MYVCKWSSKNWTDFFMHSEGTSIALINIILRTVPSVDEKFWIAAGSRVLSAVLCAELWTWTAKWAVFKCQDKVLIWQASSNVCLSRWIYKYPKYLLFSTFFFLHIFNLFASSCSKFTSCKTHFKELQVKWNFLRKQNFCFEASPMLP